MLRKTLTSLLFVSAFGLNAQNVLLQTDFKSGIPSNFSKVNMDAMPVKTGDFNHIAPQAKWFAEKVDNQLHTTAALSTSHRQYDMDTDNWLITPQLTLPAEGEIWLTWDARSIHYDLLESYEVLVSETDKEPESFRPLFATKGEAYIWQHRMLSLKNLAGKQIYIAFRHTARNKFLLALDNMFVGSPETVSFDAVDSTKHFVSNQSATAKVEGTLRVTGTAANVAALECTDGNGTVSRIEVARTLTTSEELPYAFNLSMTTGKVSSYKVEAVTTDGKRYELASERVSCSLMPRRLLVEKCTAFWCNNCPTFNPYIYGLKHTYGEQFVHLEAHFPAINGQDPAGLSNSIFTEGLSTPNLPRIYYNRDKHNPQDNLSNTEPFELALKSNCQGVVNLEKAEISTDQTTITGRVSLQFAEDLDNSTGKYRLGFALVEKVVQYGYNYQKNNSLNFNDGEFYFLPSTVPADLMFYHNVARGTDTAFKGVAGSIPATIKQGETYTTDYSFTINPKNFYKVDNNLAVICYLLNTASSKAVNVAELDVVPAMQTGIAQLPETTTNGTLTLLPGYMQVDFTNAGIVTVYTIDGRLVKQTTPTSHHTLSTAALAKGCYVVKMEVDGKVTTKRVVVE